MTSRLALLMLVACGTPRAQPQVATVEEASLDARVVRVDAAIAAPPTDSPADAAIDAPAVATADADPPQANDAPEKDGATTDDAEADDVETADEYENGVRVVKSTYEMYCIVGGKMNGACYLSRRSCARKAKRCNAKRTYACFGYAVRTTGKQDLVCATTYGVCMGIAREFDRADEFTDVTDCTIFRAKK